MPADVSSGAVERVGQQVTVRARMWPRGQRPDDGVLEVVDNAARTAPVASLLVEGSRKDGGRFKALVHGYNCSCAEEVELWERPGLILVGVGQAVTVLDSQTGAVKLRVPMGGYFNALWLSEDGRDAFICGDESVVRLVPPGIIAWQKALGVDGVMVHRAVGMTVFVSAQKRVGGPWLDYLLDRTNGNVVEAPDPEDEGEGTAPAAKPKAVAEPAKPAAKDPKAVKDQKANPVQSGGDEDDQDELDPSDVKMVRDDETDPDDE